MSSVDATLPEGAVNRVPAGYAGTPFRTLTIPGFIYAADYDKGGPGVAFCHSAAATPAQCAGGIKLNDWCCGAQKGCDQRLQPTVCPIYRADNDNAGLSHMNTGEPDNYSVSGATWAPGPNGPTLTGPTVMAGTPVPQDAHTTTQQDVYLSYLNTGQWSKYTVEVLQPGTYTIGGVMGVAAGTSISLDFGDGIATGTFMLPVSPTANCRCPETYHSWNVVSNVAMVTFPAAGTYVMTFKLLTQQFNPLYFTFTKTI